jgi:holliday junction DNA helicase RuvA
MIRTVSGKVIFAGKSYLIIEVGASGAGIGLRVFVPEPTLARYRIDMPVTLHTHLQVRENDLSLYGFESPEELSIFELLLNVNGVGPKVALSTLSTLTPDALQLAVSNKEPALVARVPGIGKRTAEKIVLELQGKLTPTGSHLEQLAQTMDVDGEVIDALTALGYSVIEAQRAVQKIPSGVVSIEERLRAALSQFSD